MGKLTGGKQGMTTLTMNTQRVLIIDDQKTNLKILGDILRTEVDVTLAHDGEQGIRKAISYQPDLILLDIVMPDMDGFEVISRLKRHASTCSIPVIFITSLSDTDHEVKGLQSGACDYIYKPFHPAIVMARIRLHLELCHQRRMLEELANIDPLTGLANRRRYDETLDKEWRAAIRQKSTISLVMLDIDNFKEYNDHYGHACGDNVLRQVAAVLQRSLKRPGDFIARYGGEEFIIILPDSEITGSKKLIDDCRRAVQQLKLPHARSPVSDYISISAGGVSCQPTQPMSPAQILKHADAMLYEAKNRGKNQLLWHDDIVQTGNSNGADGDDDDSAIKNNSDQHNR